MDLTLGTTGDYAPFSTMDLTSPSGYSGLDIDLALELCKHLQCNLRLVAISWVNIQRTLLDNLVDGVISGITVSDDRKNWALLTDAYLESETVVLCHQNDWEIFEHLAVDKLQALPLAVNRGGFLENLARTTLGFKNIVTTTANKDLPKLILDQSCQLILSDSLEAATFTKLFPLRILKTMGKQNHAILLAKRHARLCGDINGILKQLQKNGTLHNIIANYLPISKTTGA